MNDSCIAKCKKCLECVAANKKIPTVQNKIHVFCFRACNNKYFRAILSLAKITLFSVVIFLSLSLSCPDSSI